MPSGSSRPSGSEARSRSQMRSRLKGFLFVVGLSVVSAVTLRLLFDRVSESLAPPVAPAAPAVTVAEVERRFVGCGRFNFVFDERGYSSRQWPDELVAEGPLFRADAFFVAREGRILPVLGDSLAAPIGRYEVRNGAEPRVEVAFGSGAGAGAPVLLATLVAQGDSLAGALYEGAVGRSSTEVPAQATGRLFLQTPDPRPAACG